MWAIGVITYFLLCGYTPFDCDNSMQEIQAILKADYAFEPQEYWEKVSPTAKDFVRKLLVVDPAKRLTAYQALEHPWLMNAASENGTTGGNCGGPDAERKNLLPHMRANFNARRTFRKAVDMVKLVNNLSHFKSAVDGKPLRLIDVRPLDED